MSATAESNAPIAHLAEQVSALGPRRFALVFTLAFASLLWLAGGLANGWWWHPPGLVNLAGVNIGRDFVAFWSAAGLALTGQPASAYDHAALHAAEFQAIGAPVKFTAWFYPPFVQLLSAPLALMPYLSALALWLLAPLSGLLIVVRRFAPHVLTALATLIFPATAQCLITGQNGVLTALIVAAGLLQLERRPILAGLILGTLSYKPHIAAAVFAALLFGRYWRSLGTAVAVAVSLAAASIIAFGLEPWIAFLRESHYATTLLEDGQLPWEFMVTVFAAARLAGFAVSLSYALQAVTALGALVALYLVWRRPGPLAPRAAVLAAIIPLTTPFAYNYDLVVVVLALIWLVREGLQTGFRRGEVAVLALAWAAPVAGWLFASWSHVVVTPIVLVLLLGVLLRRIFSGAYISRLPQPVSALRLYQRAGSRPF